jgi:hypothetical protein
MIKTFLPALLLSLGCLMVLPQQQAIAGQILTVEVDESQLMTLPSTPGAITKLILHGRGFGQTTLTILDLDGNQIANFKVIGKHTQVSNVAVFRGADRYSYSCAPYCESEIQVGDKLDYTSGLIVQSTAKLELSTGSKTAEAEAPQAPQ